jgi:hypothetical protein
MALGSSSSLPALLPSLCAYERPPCQFCARMNADRLTPRLLSSARVWVSYGMTKTAEVRIFFTLSQGVWRPSLAGRARLWPRGSPPSSLPALLPSLCAYERPS